jgi:hypothetical protein
VDGSQSVVPAAEDDSGGVNTLSFGPPASAPSRIEGEVPQAMQKRSDAIPTAIPPAIPTAIPTQPLREQSFMARPS